MADIGMKRYDIRAVQLTNVASIYSDVQYKVPRESLDRFMFNLRPSICWSIMFIGSLTWFPEVSNGKLESCLPVFICRYINVSHACLLSLSFSLFSRLIVSDLSHVQSGLLSLFRFLLSLLCPFRVSKCYFQSYWSSLILCLFSARSIRSYVCVLFLE